MADKIFRGVEIARFFGHKTYRDWLIRNSLRVGKPWNGKTTTADPVKARIDYGRWIGDCECGGAEYVDPDEPIFYCQTCGNAAHNGFAREVVFPDARDSIEKAVLERKVLHSKPVELGLPDLRVQLVDGIPQSWNPGETVKDLREQHQIAKLARRNNGV